MSRVKSFIVLFLTLVFIFITAMTGRSPKVQAEALLTSDFTQLNAAQLVLAMGAGWNLGNQLEANINGTPSETAWGNPTITQALIQTVKEAGFNTIRIPVSYLSKIGSAPNYTVDTAWLARIKEVVDYAYNQGMYVIINMHGDGYGSVTGSWLLCNASDQTTIKTKYQKVWQQIANVFINYDEHLIFESMNEEFDGTYGTPNAAYYSNLNDYNQIFVDTVRQTGGNNSARWLLIPGWNTNIDYTAGDYGFEIPTDTYRSSVIPGSEKRLMISAHYYSPWDFCGDNYSGKTQWGATAADASKVSTWGQEDYMELQLQLMHDEFVAQGYPVVMGEYGAIDKTSSDSTNNTYRQAFAETFCAYCKDLGCIPVVWDNGYNGEYGFGLFDRSALAVTQQGIIDAILTGMNTVIPPNSTISPAEATFDKNTSAQSDITIAMTLYTNMLSGIRNGTTALAAGTDYTVSGSVVTISRSYLNTLTIGQTTLTFDFSAGKDAALTVNVMDSSDNAGSFKIQEYNASTAASVNTLSPKLKMVNTGTVAIELYKVKIRYYYTIDDNKAQSFTCDWSTVGSDNITGKFVQMSTAKTDADYYLEIGFSSGAGNLAAGQSIEIQIRINRTDWSNYTQTNDYSFNGSSSNYTDWSYITAYKSGNLKWGTEP
jgi:endoglucanase